MKSPVFGGSSVMHDVYILKGLVQNGEKNHHFSIRDIYIFIHGCCFFSPVVFGKKIVPGELGEKGWILERLEEIGWLVQLAVPWASPGSHFSTMKIIVCHFGMLEIPYLKCSFCFKHPCF